MSTYVPPNGQSVTFNLSAGYAPPLGGSVVFELSTVVNLGPIPWVSLQMGVPVIRNRLSYVNLAGINSLAVSNPTKIDNVRRVAKPPSLGAVTAFGRPKIENFNKTISLVGHSINSYNQWTTDELGLAGNSVTTLVLKPTISFINRSFAVNPTQPGEVGVPNIELQDREYVLNGWDSSAIGVPFVGHTGAYNVKVGSTMAFGIATIQNFRRFITITGFSTQAFGTAKFDRNPHPIAPAGISQFAAGKPTIVNRNRTYNLTGWDSYRYGTSKIGLKTRFVRPGGIAPGSVYNYYTSLYGPDTGLPPGIYHRNGPVTIGGIRPQYWGDLLPTLTQGKGDCDQHG